jgi:hypothetical protein
MPQWQYKFVISENKAGDWHVIEDDDVRLEGTPIQDYLNVLGGDGWELVAVVPVENNERLKHVLKKALP